MICKKCGTELPNDAQVCTSCGEPQNTDVFSPESEWVKEREAKEGRKGKKIITFLTLFVCISLLAASHLVNLIPVQRSYNDELPPFAAIEGENGDISIISTDNKKLIKISEGADVKDLMLNEKEDTLFFIVVENETSTLCSRYISNLIYESNVVAKDVESYLINNTAKIVAYKTEDGSLMYGETDKPDDHMLVRKNVGDYYLSYRGNVLIYTAEIDGVPYIYKFDGESTDLVCKDAVLLDMKQNLRKIYFRYGGGLFVYDTFSEESKCIAASFSDIIGIYDDESIIYYTVPDRTAGTLSLMYSKNDESGVLSDNFAGIITAHRDVPLLVYSEFNGTSRVYKLAKGQKSSEQTVILGTQLSDFTFTDDGTTLYYLDKSNEQSNLVKIDIRDGVPKGYSVVDTDVKLVCGLIDDKPLYIKNFNPITMTVSLYFDREMISDQILVRDASGIDTHMLQPVTFDYDTGEAKASYLATIPLRDSESHMFYDSNGMVCKFDGVEISKITESEAEDLYLISGDCILYSTGTGFYIRQRDRNTEVNIDVKNFIYIEPYGNKPYQLAGK